MAACRFQVPLLISFGARGRLWLHAVAEALAQETGDRSGGGEYALGKVKYALGKVKYALGNMKYALGNMKYALGFLSKGA